MATKNKNKYKKMDIPEHYEVRVRKMNRIVDTVLALIFLGLACLTVKMLVDSGGISKSPTAFVLSLFIIPVLLYLSFWYYPKYIFEKVEVNGDEITFHQLYFRKHTITFKDIDDLYFDGKKDSAEDRNNNGSHAVKFEFGKNKYRLPCDFCDDWPILKQDLKQRGIAIRR